MTNPSSELPESCAITSFGSLRNWASQAASSSFSIACSSARTFRRLSPISSLASSNFCSTVVQKIAARLSAV